MTDHSAEILVPRHLSVYFADDLRQEVDGKITLVGIYQSEMIFPVLPATLPKLAVVMMAITPADRPFGRLVFKILRNGETFQTFEVSAEQLANAQAATKDVKVDGIRVVEMHFAAVLGPMALDGPCIFRTRLETESETIAGRSLTVRSASPPSDQEAA